MLLLLLRHLQQERSSLLFPLLRTSFQSPEPLVVWPDISASIASFDAVGLGIAVVADDVGFGVQFLPGDVFGKFPVAPQDEQ